MAEQAEQVGSNQAVDLAWQHRMIWAREQAQLLYPCDYLPALKKMGLSMGDIQTFLASPLFTAIVYYVTTLFGAASMYVFSQLKGFEGAIPLLKRFFPHRSEVFYNWADFCIVILIGSTIGAIVFTPTTLLQALSAGFGWVGVFNILMKTDYR